MQRPLSPITNPTVLVLLLLVLLWPSMAAAQPETALPDTVLATVGERKISKGEFLSQWARVGRALVAPDADPEETKRQFLEQLIDREVLALAALDAGFEPTPAQEAHLGAVRQGLMRQQYYRRTVLAGLPTGNPEQDQETEKKRYEELAGRLLDPLSVTYVDSNLIFLADGFSKLAADVEKEQGVVRLTLANQFPRMTHTDSARVLATSSLGEFSIGRFWWHWGQLNPASRSHPVTRDEVAWWVDRFLVQGPMDTEARELGYDHLPEIEQQLAKQLDGFAAEWYYKTHILSNADTSETALRAWWEKDPSRYYGVASYTYRRLGYPSRSMTDSALAVAREGAAWEDLVTARYPQEADSIPRRLAQGSRALLISSPDSTLRTLFAAAEPGEMVGPREDRGIWWLYQYLGFQEARHSTFEQVRTFVTDDVLREESDRLLRLHLDRLRESYLIKVNDDALLSLVLPADG